MILLNYTYFLEHLTYLHFRSLLWLGPALLFSTATAISVLGWDGIVRTILSVSLPNAVLVGALNDRLLLANPTDVNPRQKKGVEIKSCLVGLLEPLLIGFATMQHTFEQKLDLSEILYQITSRFDSLRITPRSLDILARGPPVCGDLAVSLSQAGPQFTQVLRGVYAIKALRFSTALDVLKDEFLRSRDYPKCPPTSHLFHRFRQLGYACIKYGQFDSAKETFEVIADYEGMLDLFICHLNPSAMRRLAQKLEEEGLDSQLRRYCERILRVRSTGWTQGIFANFAAESMVPKGPEWGGGNWEIKTPTNLKSIPQWELAGEVMPYMKTDDGTIPAIITDHIGVYLGSIKGRGNVVEVREDSLVKAFIPASDNKPNGLPNALAKSISNKSNGLPEGHKKLDSLLGLETLTKQNAGTSAADEQAKAEEEFKKTMYGTANDGSSSDEEGVSKTKKLQIRIRDKPVSSTTVDVNKIKEATRQFKLGDGLGPPMRTKSLTGSQDLGQILSQPPATTAPVFASADMFVTDSLMQPAPVSQPGPMVMGGGVTAGPIPEDFFQNTIPSLQVAASLPPPGTYLAKLDQVSQGVGSNNAGGIPNPGAASVSDIGLPDGGIPPQATQLAAPLAYIGLADGGVPPQASIQAGIPPQPQVQAPQVPLSTQPLDLSVLGVTDSGKTPAPASLPSSVRPGQVPRGAAAPVCFKTGLAHLEQNQLPDALSCFDEAFLALAKDNSRGADIKAQATICAQYKIAVTLLKEIARLQKVQGPSALSAKDEMARLSRHLGSLPLLAKHRINCIRTAIKRNMEVQNFAYGKQMLELLISKAPPSKQDELRSLIDMCVQRGSSNKSIDPLEDPSHFCAATLSRLSTIGYDVCDLCGAKFSALSAPGCIICGMGSIKRSDALAGPVPSPFG
uniref:Transducin family protein n=2 Tax=Populus TaxID=3689 RepID=A0A4U5QRJ9_POPAL|nr:transducin family protein [Populus alba]